MKRVVNVSYFIASTQVNPTIQSASREIDFNECVDLYSYAKREILRILSQEMSGIPASSIIIADLQISNPS